MGRTWQTQAGWRVSNHTFKYPVLLHGLHPEVVFFVKMKKKLNLCFVKVSTRQDSGKRLRTIMTLQPIVK